MFSYLKVFTATVTTSRYDLMAQAWHMYLENVTHTSLSQMLLGRSLPRLFKPYEDDTGTHKSENLNSQ